MAGDRTVDTHTHFYDPTRPQGVPWPRPTERILYRQALPRHFRAQAGPEGVSATVVVEASAFAAEHSPTLAHGFFGANAARVYRIGGS